MRKTVALVLGTALVAATAMQAASAHEHHHIRKIQRAPAPETRTYRDSNAYYWPAQPSVPNWSRYANGAMSAPAGR